MTVTLTAAQEKFVAEQMEKGGYSSPEKVLEEGLKLIQAKEEYQWRLAELRRDLQVGVDQIERGEVIDGKDVFDRVQEKNQKRPRVRR